MSCMNCCRSLVIAVVAILGVPTSGQPRFDANAGRQLAGSILVDGRSFEYVAELTDKFGSRLTGSLAYQRAAEWTVAEFRAAGIARVAAEPFTIARGWQRGIARGRMVAPLERPLHLESLGWMPSTPEGGIEGDIAVVADLAPERIAADPSLRGRIALVGPSADSGESADRLKLRDHLDARLREAGAIAVLWPDGDPNNVLSARSTGFGTEVGVLPSAQVGREDVQLIRRLLDNGPVRIAFELHNEVSPGPITVNNVIAEIRGGERPDEWVIVGAHLDSWDFGTGAQDNGTGVAMVLDAARAIAALARSPRRSIRFALWGGEEQGLIGSMAYVRAHEAELAHCVANINTDGGSGRVRGFLTPGRHDVAVAMRPISQTLLAGLGAAALDESMRYAFQSDDGPFILNGIPALDLNPDEAKYEEVHHKTSDTIDKIDRHDLAVGAAAVAIAAFAIADAPQPIAPHLDRPAIAAMLAAARMDRVLQMNGMWKPGS
jgi:carboxypeptidase Q